jgi:undecaprenyl-diphosphatase
MGVEGVETVLQSIEALELRLCRGLNRHLAQPGVRFLFVAVSRLGDGPLWYAVILAMPFLTATPAAVQMAATGLLATGLQAMLKTRLARERPFVTSPAIALGTAPLDRYSFPSGHTLHAVCFTTIALHHVPALGWLLVPFTALVMASRIVLGLHYPSDVLAGAVLGLALATGSRLAVGF